MSKAKQTAATFLASCQEAGLSISTRNETVVTVQAIFAPGDRGAFTRLDGVAPGLLGLLGARGGSMWGTDGASVGGATALRSGRFTLNVSGVPKRTVAALNAAVAE